VAGWQKADSKYGVSIEKGTSGVPDDGKYHVVVDGEIVLSTRVEAAAIAEFEEVREQRRASQRKLLREERGNAAFRLMMIESRAEKFRRDSRKGGRKT
jgi:hypothetical protein